MTDPSGSCRHGACETASGSPPPSHARDIVPLSPGHQAVYDYLARMRPESLTEEEHRRIAATIALLPFGVATILDVGCGDGRLLHSLRSGTMSVGVDCSPVSLRRLKAPAVCADGQYLPFADRSFDLTLCCEVLEHLQHPMLLATVQELARVSRRYVLVTVPYQEELSALHLLCSACGAVFHIWGHLNSFSRRSLDRLFPGFWLIARRYCGTPPPYRSPLVTWINQRLGDRWAEPDAGTICPRCANTHFTRSPRNMVTIACGLIHRTTAALVPIFRKNWMLSLYARRH